jgi:hypothetical protein
VSCSLADCALCRPHGMVEWGLLAAWHMREQDDEGIGGVKRPCPRGGWSPFNWWCAARRRQNRAIVPIAGSA